MIVRLVVALIEAVEAKCHFNDKAVSYLKLIISSKDEIIAGICNKIRLLNNHTRLLKRLQWLINTENTEQKLVKNESNKDLKE